MGVPSFYRWLVDKYPKIVVKAVEAKGFESTDATLPNPNGWEIDNLYLDMNAIIHPCFHPDNDHDDDNLYSPTTFEEVFYNIFDFIDRIFSIVRPRKLLYMAIDGVAPRAKMNQQRSRRFRTAKDVEIAEKEEERLRRLFEIQGLEVLPKMKSEVTDSNVITPGTQFMHRLSKELQSYIRCRMKKDPAWKSIKVILSDANVPGEGEHKIMSFIRLQRTLASYNPNTSHCLYGSDADLIMLALATHELHFSILREDVQMEEKKPFGKSAVEFLCPPREADQNTLLKSRGRFKQSVLKQDLKDCAEEGPFLEICTVNRKKPLVKKPYQFLRVWILREYLELDVKITNPPEKFEAEFERMIDDFIFICFFAGNDFLPHMPNLEIHEDAMDLLLHVYKEEFKNLGGYLVDMQRVDDHRGGYIKLKRVEKFILCVGTYEEKIFKKRSELKERKLKQILARDTEQEEIEDPKFMDSTPVSDLSSSSGIKLPDSFEIMQNTKEMKEQLKNYTRKKSDVFKDGLCKDKVRLGADGWKKRYYEQKFSAHSQEDIESIRKAVVEKYTEGLCWVLLYYFSGVPSWTWFYPFHYAPFASDMKGLTHTRVRFQKGLPFKPFDQLMGVLPPKSFLGIVPRNNRLRHLIRLSLRIMCAHALPPSYQSLMTDEHSDIIDFYPDEFEIDTDGKRHLWQGICKLPFIEEERLVVETKKIEKELNEDEASRNAESHDMLFINSSSILGSTILSVYKTEVSMKQKGPVKIDTSLSGGINGFMLEAENVGDSKGPLDDCNVLCVFCQRPASIRLHCPRLLDGVEKPDSTISEGDIMERQLWHEYRPCNRIQNPRPIRNLVSSSANQSCGYVIKGAGTGWSAAGRDKTCKFPPNSPRQQDFPPNSPRQQDYRYTRTPGMKMASPYKSSAREMIGSRSKWDAPHDNSRGIENMRISESNPYGRGRNLNDGLARTGGTSLGFNSNRVGRQGRVQYSSTSTPSRPECNGWRKDSLKNASNCSWQRKCDQTLVATTIADTTTVHGGLP